MADSPSTPAATMFWTPCAFCQGICLGHSWPSRENTSPAAGALPVPAPSRVCYCVQPGGEHTQACLALRERDALFAELEQARAALAEEKHTRALHAVGAAGEITGWRERAEKAEIALESERKAREASFAAACQISALSDLLAADVTDLLDAVRVGDLIKTRERYMTMHARFRAAEAALAEEKKARALAEREWAVTEDLRREALVALESEKETRNALMVELAKADAQSERWRSRYDAAIARVLELQKAER